MPPKDIRTFFGCGSLKSGATTGTASKRPPEQDAKTSPSKVAKGPRKGTKQEHALASRKRKAIAVDDSDDDFMVESEESDDGDMEKEQAPLASRATPRRKMGPHAVVVLDESDNDDIKRPSRKPTLQQKSPKATPVATLVEPTQPRSRKSVAKGDPQEGLSEPVRQARAAVTAAAALLPSNKELLDSGRVTRMPEGGGGWGGGGGADKEPEHQGVKEIPEGQQDCLGMYTFVISGVLDSMYRQDAEDYIKRHGGRITSAVSGKTSFLLCGKETGNSKLSEAERRSTRLIDEDGLLSLVKASTQFVEKVTPALRPGSAASPAQRPSYVISSSASHIAAPACKNAAPICTSDAPSSRGDQLWVDKWKPTSFDDLVGNQQGVKTLQMWLSDWERVHLHGGAPQSAPGAGGGRKDMGKKAILMSGTPGIGKTTAAILVARQLGYDVVEVNASDTRNKSDAKVRGGIAGKTANRIHELVTNTAIAASSGRGQPRKQVLVMDEVDGMSGGDRGGVSDLIASIKLAKVPIICICNDKYKQSLKSLKNHCLELDWRKPTKLQAGSRLRQICQAEGVAMNQAAMDALVESSQGDMRVMLGQLQMHRLSAASLTYADVKAAAAKDMDKSPFECARQLLAPESARLSIVDRVDCVFQDMDLVPLLVQENYVNHRPNMAVNPLTGMQVLAKAADAFSFGDVINKRVRLGREWSLMPVAALVGSVYPASYMRGMRETFSPNEMNFPRFTAWLGNNSSSSKQRRIAGELSTKLLAAGAVCDRRALRLHYLPVLRHALTAPLATDGAEGIDVAIELMRTYLINREDLDAILDITKFKTSAQWGADPMRQVETKVKSAFTRAFNKVGLQAKTTIMVEDGKRSSRSARAAVPDDEELSGELAEAAAVNANDENEDEEAPTAEELAKLQGVAFTANQSKPKGKGKAKVSTGRGKGPGGRGSQGNARGRGRGRGKAV